MVSSNGFMEGLYNQSVHLRQDEVNIEHNLVEGAPASQGGVKTAMFDFTHVSLLFRFV